MEFTVNSTKLLQYLNRVIGVVDKKSTIACLQDIYVTTRNNNGSNMPTIDLAATDLDISLVTTGEVISINKPEESFCINAQTLFDLLSNLKDQTITIKKLDNDRVEILASKSRYKIAGHPADQFPSIYKPTQSSILSLPASSLEFLIKQTIFAITIEESQRFSLSGAQLEINKDNIKMITTDGHRLAMATVNINSDIDTSIKHLIPKKTLAILANLVSRLDWVKNTNLEKEKQNPSKSNVSLGIENNERLYFIVDETLVISRTMTGQFPNYNLVVPKATQFSLVANREEFLTAIRRARLMATKQQDGSRGVKIDVGQDNLELHTYNTDSGEAHENIEIKDYNGSSVVLGLNAKYLSESLSVLDFSKEILLKFNDPKAQIVVTGKEQQAEGLSSMSVIMQMRV